VRFQDFLRRPLRRPLVFLDRPRFVRRHLHAMLLASLRRFRAVEQAPCWRTRTWELFAEPGFLRSG
jgi:hypothetical protein